jgi:uncharacterized membrane protein YccC
MADAVDQSGLPLERTGGWVAASVNVVRASGPPLLFGLRLWASVCLALYIAFWLELDVNAYWAGTTAALVCQPQLGASLRKGWFRTIGTLVGAIAIVILTARFPQNRVGFLAGLALWGGACALVATLLRNFAAYAAALAGYTAAIIASDQLGATGGPNGLAFTLAIARVSEIWIGIVCAGIVLGATDFGSASRRLAAQFAALAADIAKGFASALAMAGVAPDDQQPLRREFIRRVIALDPVIDQSMGESSTVRYHSPVLQAAVGGLFDALSAWRTVATRLTRLPKDVARQYADAVQRSIPEDLRSTAEAEPRAWTNDPIGMRGLCEAAVQMLTSMPAGTPSLRSVADQSAKLLAGLAAVPDALALLAGVPAPPRSRRRRAKLSVPDWLPALVNGGRAVVTIGAVEVFWIITQWPSGALAITFAAIVVILLAPRADEAYASAMSFMLGTSLATVGAAITLFAILPKVETFMGFSLVIGLYLIPVGALMAQPWQTTTFVPMVANFIPLLAPANQQSYDTVQFYNTALAIFGGCCAAAVSFRLLPPLSPEFRCRRLLSLTLRDLRRLATNRVLPSSEDWEARIHSRLVVMPDVAQPLQRAQVVAALSVGSEIMRLRHAMPSLGLGPELDAALEALAQGSTAAAIAAFNRLDHGLASLANRHSQTSAILSERGRILLICDSLARYRAYFDSEGPG